MNSCFWLKQFLQRKSQFPQSAKLIVALKSSYKGGEYGIPDFNWCCSDDGSLRGNHRQVLERAGMAIAFIADCIWIPRGHRSALRTPQNRRGRSLSGRSINRNLG